MKRFAFTALALFLIPLTIAISLAAEANVLKLNQRSQTKAADGTFVQSEKPVNWEAKKTAAIVIDMWDDHWCKSAAKRCGEVAVPMNDVVKKLREQGVFIIHAPSSCMDFYKDTPQRKLALSAKMAAPPKPFTSEERFGTKWNYLNPDREGPLPIDDRDGGCDCKDHCEKGSPWKRQVATIEIADGDAITDNGQETWNLLQERGIENVMIMGVHLNMCVLGRPFAIRQMKYLGKNVVLIRDMTDTMYNPESSPNVSHFDGTDLMIGHVEKFWCPTIASSDITGKKAYRFKDDPRK